MLPNSYLVLAIYLLNNASGKLKHLIHLHFLVFIAGFTAILGKLISLESSIWWFRMLFALVLMFLFLKFRAIHFKVNQKLY